MREHFVITGMNGEGNLEIDFDSEEEALSLIHI